MDRITTGILDTVCGRFGTGRNEFANSSAFEPGLPSRVVPAVIGECRSLKIYFRGLECMQDKGFSVPIITFPHAQVI